jgi:hypothetical protein
MNVKQGTRMCPGINWLRGGVKLNAFVRTGKELSVIKVYVYLNR